ncbi:hypothetical protein E4T66_06875 [Sinimarinibacterium sp. CAU 1509]|nr:hypothetical protein E4T66_06875 [Sinimarinibacterium sp. CAU 1509]
MATMTRALTAGAVAVFLSGCTIVPGLNVSPSGTSGLNASSVQEVSDSEVVYTLENQTGPIQKVRVVTLGPQTLNLRKLGDAWSTVEAEAALSSVSESDAVVEYRIGPGDILSIVVWDHPELTNPTGEFRDLASGGRLVAWDGTMFYPYVGSFKVAGMTPGELRDFLADKLSRVITRPQVDVRVADFRSKRVQVTGEVRTPGLVVLDDTAKGVIEAINERGGLAEAASRREVVLRRGDKTYPIDMASLLTGNLPGANPLLQAGDQIHVPDRSEDQIFVLGRVKKEGSVLLERHHTTLTQVIAESAGLEATSGDDSGVLVFRRPSGADAEATVFRVDLSSSIGLLAAGEFEVQPRDVVYVSPTSFSKYNSVINQLLPTISAVFQLDRLINN